MIAILLLLAVSINTQIANLRGEPISVPIRSFESFQQPLNRSVKREKTRGALSLRSAVAAPNNLFLVVSTGQPFYFARSADMRSFLKSAFEGCSPQAVFPQQRLAPNQHLFDVLLTFPFGIPRSSCKVTFSYDGQGYYATESFEVVAQDLPFMSYVDYLGKVKSGVY